MTPEDKAFVEEDATYCDLLALLIFIREQKEKGLLVEDPIIGEIFYA